MSGTLDADAVFAASARHRRAFADLVESLTAAELDTPSLCTGWTVRQVAGHLSVAVTGARIPYLVGIVKAFGRPHTANRIVAAEAARRPVAELVRTIREQAESRFVPPVGGPRAPLGDVIVHTGDIARPLHRAHEAEPDAVGWVLDFVTGPRPVGFAPSGRGRGLALVASDLGRTWGEGATVRGRGVDLVLAFCGRPAALESLDGDGVAVLASRIGG